MHVHTSVLDFLIVAAYVVLFSTLWRLIAARNAENSFGKAMGAIFS